MLNLESLEKLPEIQKGDVRLGRCGLQVELIGRATTLPEAWSLLPAAGTGVVVLADRIQRFSPTQRDGLLVEAEVAEGPKSTVILRMDGTEWRAWRWTETQGDSHRYLERLYRSSEPLGRRPPHQVYRQYWALQEEDGISIWRPVGARFCGFREEDR